MSLIITGTPPTSQIPYGGTKHKTELIRKHQKETVRSQKGVTHSKNGYVSSTGDAPGMPIGGIPFLTKNMIGFKGKPLPVYVQYLDSIAWGGISSLNPKHLVKTFTGAGRADQFKKSAGSGFKTTSNKYKGLVLKGYNELLSNPYLALSDTKTFIALTRNLSVRKAIKVFNAIKKILQ